MDSKYIARPADHNGDIHYTGAEHDRWCRLMRRQRQPLRQFAAPEYLRALDDLGLATDRIPQCRAVSEKLCDASGWKVVPVPALIDFRRFFEMLSRKEFPAASFIRSESEMDYLQEPDIFHEILGHTPLLADQRYADFIQAYGEAGCRAGSQDHAWLARLFWFTVEFGLIRSNGSLKALGAGIVSSFEELFHSMTSREVQRRPFDPIEALRTSYRIDTLQPRYFVLDNLQQLYRLADRDLLKLAQQARAMGPLPPCP